MCPEDRKWKFQNTKFVSDGHTVRATQRTPKEPAKWTEQVQKFRVADTKGPATSNSHCNADLYDRMFRELYGADYVRMDTIQRRLKNQITYPRFSITIQELLN